AACALARRSLPDGYMAYSRVAIQKMLQEFTKALAEPEGINEFEARERCGFNSAVSGEVCELLPPPIKADGKPLTNNPVVRKALFELRKVVNSIIGVYGKPSRIVVEFARRLRMPLSKRADEAA